MENNTRPARSGSLSLEALILTPVLLCLLLAIVEFGLLLANQTLIKSAAAQAAITAAMPGATEANILNTIETVLGTPRYTVLTTAPAGSFEVTAMLDGAAPVYTLFPSDGLYDAPMRPPGLQTVTICIKVKAGLLVPDLLAICGLSICNLELSGCSTASLL